MSETVHYQETQYFRQAWLWALLFVSSIPAALLGVVAVVTESDPGTNVPLTVGVVLVLVFGPLVIFYRANLRVAVRDDALALRLWPLHLRARRIPYDDIESITATEISPMGDFGGVGIRLQPSLYRWGVRFDGPVGYIVAGESAVRIERHGGRPVVLTTNDPQALARTVRRVSGLPDE